MDAIDNSAGVDCSDHEVNIKILLDTIVADGDLTGKQRNAILAEMGDEVAALVLRDNYEQTQAISSSTAQAASMVEVHERYVRQPRAGRHSEPRARGPPDGRGVRRAPGGGRRADRAGVRDPALAHQDRARPGAARLRPAGGPVPLERARALFPGAPRRASSGRSCSATRCGGRSSPHGSSTTSSTAPARPSPSASRDETGAGADDIARAYAVAREVFGLRGLWAEIEALDGRVPAADADRDAARARILLERATRWLLRNRRRPIDIAAAVARYAAGRGGARRGAAHTARPVRARGRASQGRRVRGGRRSARARAARRAPRGTRADARARRDRSGGRGRRRGGGGGLLRARRAARAALAARPDRRPAPGDALGGDGARGAPGRRLLRAGGPDRRGAAGRCGRRALAGRERERDREVAAGARRHQERRRPRPRPAVRRRARDPQPDPLERDAGAGRAAASRP